jgi:hypothetical protein
VTRYSLRDGFPIALKRREYTSGLKSAPLLVLAAAFLFVSVVRAGAETCGDADGNDQVTVTDGVNVLRAAAGLSSGCPLSSCDIDGNGAISVTDGVNVLRAAAGLSASLSCVADPFIASVQGQSGVFGALTKIPGGLIAPPGAAQTVANVAFGEGFVAGRVNTVTIKYDVGAQAQGTGTSSLLVASARDADDPTPGVFDLPLDSGQGTVSIALDLKPDIAVQQFTLKIANGDNGSVVSQIFSVIIIILRESTPTCGNRVIDVAETCDPPGFGCPFAAGGGFCNAKCACEVPKRFTDNGDGTVTDNQTGLQWEKKTGTVALDGRDCLATPCPDPHDVNNEYTWCVDTVFQDNDCDDLANPLDGGIMSQFLATLNAPPCFADHCDWRLPSLNRDGGRPELETIVDQTASGCGGGSACINPIFGPTYPNFYWSAATTASFPSFAYTVLFDSGNIVNASKSLGLWVRAVRGGGEGSSSDQTLAPRSQNR